MQEESLNKLVQKLLKELSGINRYSDNTIIAYQKDLNQFVEFLSEQKITDIKKINERKIRNFIIHLSENKISKASIARKLSAIRRLMNFAFRNELIEEDPSKMISSPYVRRKLPEVINVDSFLEIFRLLDRQEKPNTAIKYKAIFDLLYGSALRVSELCNLNMKDLDLHRKTITVLGKGNKVRYVPLGLKSFKTLSEYLETYKKINIDSPLFLSSRGNRIYPRFIYKIVKQYLSQVSAVSKKSPHTLRHAAATHMLDKGADLMAVKEFLGHENLSTTQIYTHVSIERLKDAFKKAHPKS